MSTVENMKRRKPRRSRRIVKKLLKRADTTRHFFNMDAVACDGGRRWVTAQELMEFNLPRP
jgi:hypothetical protein